MKIGFVVNYFDFRTDIRRIMEHINEAYPVVIFCKEAELEVVRKNLKASIEIRIIKEEKSTFLNAFWKLLFTLFGKIPKSRRNFYLTELFRLNREKNQMAKFKGRAVLELKRIMPDYLQYDVFLSHLRYSGQTRIDDIDTFYLFTDIYDHYFLARLLHEAKRVFVYVYSWDHPCKFLRFSKRANYLVWSEGIREDLHELQNVSPQRVKVVGATQFSYVDEFVRSDKSRLKEPYPFDYLYFGCSVATPKLLEEEVAVIKEISKQLVQLQPAMKLVVRPYPVLGNWKYYEPLRALPNVVFDDQYRAGDKSMKENAFHEKYTKIHFARGFFHLGTTLGLEACFTGTPSFIIDFRSMQKQAGYVNMYHFVHQYQNEKYLLLKEFPNVVANQADLRTIFGEISHERDKYLAYNKAVVKNFRLYSIEEVARNFLDA